MAADVRFDLAGKRVWIAGHRGMVGSAVARRLAAEACEIVTVDRSELDLRRQAEVEAWVQAARPDIVVLAAAKVGGILANDRLPAEFIYDNLMLEANIVDASHKTGVKKLLFLGSSCIYPKEAPQPMPESALLSGPLEPTNQWYAIAKIAGIKLCQAYRRQYGCDFISAMPTNLYGYGDNFDLNTSHVLPALMVRIHQAKVQRLEEVVLWGTGTPRREFLFVDDLADACVHLLRNYSGEEHVNVGTGRDISIRDAAQAIAEVVGYKGRFVQDSTKPDGPARKLLDLSKLSGTGWAPRTDFRNGLDLTYQWYLENIENVRRLDMQMEKSA